MRRPAWSYNVQAAPDITVEMGRLRTSMRAELLQGDERAAAWRQIVAAMPLSETYRAKVAREIPVFRLRPRA